MAVTPTGHTGASNIPGSTFATVVCTTGTQASTYDATGGPGYFFYRIQYSTATDFASPATTGVASQYVSTTTTTGQLFSYDHVLAPLTTNTTYYYRVQVSSTRAFTGISTATESGSFTTLTSGAGTAPTAAFTCSTTTGKNPLTVNFTDQSTNIISPRVDGAAWEWIYGTQTPPTGPAGGDTFSLEQNPTFQFTSVGTYTVTLCATNSYGTDTEAKTSLITVVAPVVTATFSTSTTKLDQNEQSRRVEVSLSDASTGDNTTIDPIQDRLWTITKPAATTETFTGPYVSTIYGTNTTEAGFYGVALTVTSKYGGTASTSNTKAFSVPYLPPVAYFVGAPMVGIVTHTVTFTNQATGDGLSYLWSFGDTATSTSTATTLTHSYTAATVATVSLVVTGSTVSGTTVTTASSSYSDTVVVNADTFWQRIGGMLQDIQWALLCDPDTTVCSAFDDFGGTDNVVSIYYRRLWQFLRDTELTKAEATLSADTAGVYPLPANLITLNRVEVDGYAVQPMDAKQADLWNSAWGTLTTDEIQGYIIEPGESLTLKLVPNRTGRTVKVVYVSASDAATVPANCTEASWAVLPLPYAFSWAVKWGTIADLLSQEGEMNDPVRAKFAEELYQLGVAVAKTMITRRGGA